MAFELRRALVTLAVTAAMTLAAGVASSGEPATRDRETARAEMAAGDEAFDAKSYAVALEHYKAAHALVALPSTGIWVAKAHEQLGQLLEARQVCIEIGRLEKKPAERDVVAAARLEAAQLAESLAPRIPSLTVRVDGLPPGSAYRLWIDDGEVATAAVASAQKLNPGRHTVRVEAEGYAPGRGEATLKEREPATLTIALTPSASSRDGGDAQAAPNSGGGGVHPLVWAGVSISGAGLLAGAIGGGVSLAAASSAKDQCDGNDCPPAAASDIDTSKATAWVSNVGFGVAGAGAVLLIVGLVLPDEPSPNKAAWSPCATARGTWGACLTF